MDPYKFEDRNRSFEGVGSNPTSDIMSSFYSVVNNAKLINLECIYKLTVCLSAQTYHGYAVLNDL